MSIVGSRGQLFFLRLDSFEHATVSVVQLNQVRRQRRALDSRKTRKFCLSHKEARTAARNLPNHGIGCSTVAGPCYSDTAGNGTFIGEIPRVASCAGHMESGQDGTGTKPLLSRDSAESAVWGPPCFHEDVADRSPSGSLHLRKAQNSPTVINWACVIPYREVVLNVLQ